jgi:hypothetical protein
MQASHPYLTSKLPQSYQKWVELEGVTTGVFQSNSTHTIEVATFEGDPNSDTITYF